MTPVASVVPVVALLVSFNVLLSDHGQVTLLQQLSGFLMQVCVCVLYMRACIQIAVR